MAADSDTDWRVPIPLDPRAIGPWVLNHHYPHLIEEITTAELSRPPGARGSEDAEASVGVPEEERIFRVSFAELQRMHLRKLQVKLVKHTVDMRISKKESANWEDDLARYSEPLCYPSLLLLRCWLATGQSSA